MTRTSKPLLAVACVAASLFQSAAGFTVGGLSSPPAVHAKGKRRNLESSLHLSASNLFGSSTSFPPLRSLPQDDPLVNNRYSASDWLHNVFTLPQSSVLRDIRNPVITIAVWSTLVSVIHRMIRTSSNKLVSKFASDMCIGGAPHSFLVSSLGLLLVFRTNSAYQRFNVSLRLATVLCCVTSVSVATVEFMLT